MNKKIEMERMPQAFPVRFADSVGTAFLVFYKDQLWLLTCAHLFSGIADTPVGTEVFNNGYVSVLGSHLKIDLFKDGRQNFNIVRSAGTNYYFDAIAIPLNSHEVRQFSKYGCFNVTQFPIAAIGEEVLAMGFVESTEQSTKQVILNGRVEQVHGVSIRLSVASINGVSGGYLVSPSGLLGMVHANNWTEAAAHTALAVSFAVLEPALFTPLQSKLT